MKIEEMESGFWQSGKWAIIQVVALAIILVGAVCVVFQMPQEVAYKSRTEEGVFEQLTIVLYVVAIATCLAVVFIKRWYSGFYVAILLAVLCMRELDFHKRSTQSGKIESVTSTRFWRSDDVALLEKMVIAIILLAAAFALYRCLRCSMKRLLVDIKRGRPYAISIVGFLIFPAVALTVDKLFDMEELDKPIVLFFSLLEEGLEVGIPVLACMALIQWARSDCPGPDSRRIESAAEKQADD